MLPVAAGFIIITAILFTSMGVAIASSMEDMQGFQLIVNFLVMPIFFLSGALFPLQGLPRAMEIVTRINPLTYGIDGMRGALINGSRFGIAHNFIILCVLTGIVLAIGNFMFERVEA
jgi:ABC-2 type transport system permease protein